MRNELNELAVFATVAQERSFTRAAARLGLSQSSVSHTIRGVEKRLGLQLLARTTRSVSPTTAGAAVLKELTPALDQIERSILGRALEEQVAELIMKRRLIRALEDWCPPFPGFFLYYPSRRNQPAALVALINAFVFHKTGYFTAIDIS